MLLSALVVSAVMLSGSSAIAANQTITCNGVGPYTNGNVEILTGEKVTWDCGAGGFMAHPLVSDQMLWMTYNGGNATFEHTFTAPGTFTYKCAFAAHEMMGMKGTVKVTDPAVVTPPPTTTTTTTPPPTTTTTTTPTPPPDTTPPTTTLSASATLKIGGLLTKGATVTVKANEDATIAATLSVGNKVVASGNATATANADVKVALKVTKAGKAFLKKKRTVSATLQVVTTDKAGNKKTDKKKIKLRK